MLTREKFIQISLETNLFFQRIMKEHLFFIETNLQPVEASLINEANSLKKSFEQLLHETVVYADGLISESAIRSNEFVTPYTLRAEKVTSRLTGAGLNTMITKAELELASNPKCVDGEQLESIVYAINARSINLLKEVIAFQRKILDLALGCKIFVTLYPEILEHVTWEAIYYLEMLKCLQNRKLPKKAVCEELDFWNNIMGEHGQFIDGMLDPSEEVLKGTAEGFAEQFEKLVEDCIKEAEKQIIHRSLVTTEEIRDFKEAATEGLLECEIKSIIPLLLADHVLREANHYLRLLRMMKGCR
ncbi:DUF2935 domain-containing protein [Desulfofalx alkaliphila]|uniref:DUF2935 domain-containing protein n=1 Tax=Desulfofalx alkaliphila TaxID=105483 RepID=UPI0004E26927|nr:DUF2935 domain-containing protein [Desulfofalx alkaliphila]